MTTVVRWIELVLASMAVAGGDHIIRVSLHTHFFFPFSSSSSSSFPLTTTTIINRQPYANVQSTTIRHFAYVSRDIPTYKQIVACFVAELYTSTYAVTHLDTLDATSSYNNRLTTRSLTVRLRYKHRHILGHHGRATIRSHALRPPW
jgi:hypothetical protein